MFDEIHEGPKDSGSSILDDSLQILSNNSSTKQIADILGPIAREAIQGNIDEAVSVGGITSLIYKLQKALQNGEIDEVIMPADTALTRGILDKRGEYVRIDQASMYFQNEERIREEVIKILFPKDSPYVVSTTLHRPDDLKAHYRTLLGVNDIEVMVFQTAVPRLFLTQVHSSKDNKVGEYLLFDPLKPSFKSRVTGLISPQIKSPIKPPYEQHYYPLPSMRTIMKN